MDIGVVNVASKYDPNPGAGGLFPSGNQAIWDLGFRVLKVYCTGDYTFDYSGQTWSATPTTCKELLDTTEFKAALKMGWKKIKITLFTFANTNFSLPVGQRITNWPRSNHSTAAFNAEYSEVREAVEFLLDELNGYDIEITIQNWEGDWALRDKAGGNEPFISRDTIEYYLAFYGARQRAVNDARKTVQSTVRVLNAIEANRVVDVRNRPDLRRVLRDMPRRFRPDVISLSAYDFMIDTTVSFGASDAAWAAYHVPLAEKTLRSVQLIYPDVPIQVGEAGFPEKYLDGGVVKDQYTDNGHDCGFMTTTMHDVCELYGVTDYIHWQIYDNELVDPDDAGKGPRGYGIIKPDGNLSRQGNALVALL